MRYKDETFTDDKILLDGNEYVGCTFKACELQYGGGQPPFMNNNDIGDSQFSFVDAAANTLQFLSALYHGFGSGGRDMVEATFENVRNNSPTKEH